MPNVDRPGMRGTTHWDGCWKAHGECAIAMLERWWPVIEAAKEYAKARFEYERYDGFDSHLLAIMDLAAQKVFDTTVQAMTGPAQAVALKEGSADG